MRKCSGDRWMPTVGTRSKPASETVHQVGNVAGHRRCEDQVPVRVSDPVLALPVLTGSQHRVDTLEDTPVDLPDRLFVDAQPTARRDLVHERERVTRGNDLERVLLPTRPPALEERLDLQVIETVPLDTGGPVDRPDPGAVPEPLLVPRVEPEVVQQPAEPFDALGARCQRTLVEPVVHEGLPGGREPTFLPLVEV